GGAHQVQAPDIGSAATPAPHFGSPPPANNPSYEHGATVPFTASASDVEDTSLTIHWSSSRDGDLGTGASLSTSSLTSGTHTITASVTDSGGKSASSSITIVVNSTPTVSITAPATNSTYEHDASATLTASASH